jgi:UDP-glucose 4-epimerase
VTLAERRRGDRRASGGSAVSHEGALERVLVTGSSGALGRNVVAHLAADPRVGDVFGIDVERLEDVVGARPAPSLTASGGGVDFVALDPRDRRIVSIAVKKFAPTAVLHLGIYEPDARMTPRVADERTTVGTYTVLGAASDTGALRRIVVRSGIEVYGRRPGTPHTPDESVVPDPTTPFGRALLRVEQVAAATGESVRVPVTALRFAPVVGPTVRSPMQRFFQFPFVPVSALSDPPFCVIHVDDAARAVLAALDHDVDGPLNCVAPGAVSVYQVLRRAGKVPVPVFGPQWWLTRRLSTLLGSPLPDHFLELLQRGRNADGSAARVALNWTAAHSADDVAAGLPRWSTARIRGNWEDAA